MAKQPSKQAAASSRLTLAKLEKFMQRRNKSEFSSNLQFVIDAEDCGITVDDLGPVTKVLGVNGHHAAYKWETPFGTLQEAGGRLTLYRPVSGETKDFLSRMNGIMTEVLGYPPANAKEQAAARTRRIKARLSKGPR